MDNFEALERIIREQQTRYWGKYRAFVADNADPEGRGRCKLTIPSVLGEATSDWALPAFAYGGTADAGIIRVPAVDAQVIAEFLEGDLASPIWTGTFWRKTSEVPAEYADPRTKVMKTDSGHLLVFDDTDGSEAVVLQHQTGARLELNAEGNAEITDQNGARVQISAANGEIVIEDTNGNSLTFSAQGIAATDRNGNEITTTASGVEVKGATINIEGQSVTVGGAGGEPLVKGTSFLALFNAHVHNCTALGAPSGPPITPLTPAQLTIKTTAQ